MAFFASGKPVRENTCQVFVVNTYSVVADLYSNT